MSFRSITRYAICGMGISLLCLTAHAASAPQRADETFYPIGFPADLLQAIDVDGDGDLDLVATSTSTRLRTVLLNNGSGAFEVRGAAVERAVGSDEGHVSVIGDFNADGHLDLAVAESLGANVRVQVGHAGFRGGDCPSVVATPMHQSVQDGGSAVFSVSLRGAPTLNYQWRRNGVELEDDGRVQGSMTGELIIDGVLQEDVGLYDVVVGNGCGTTTSPPGSLTLSALGGVMNAWTSSTGGSFESAVNWSGGAAPGGAETALFDLGGQYTVNVGQDASTSRLIVANDDVSLELGGFKLAMSEINPTLSGIRLGQIAGNTGVLTVRGGSIDAFNAAVGAAAGSSGHWFIESGADIKVVSRVNVGAAAPGELQVTEGGLLNAGSMGIGRPGGSGNALISGPGSGLTITGALRIGDGGPGTLDINEGASVVSANSTVGGNNDATVTVDGPGASWDAGALGMASFGNGTIVVQNGATMSSGTAELGLTSGTLATVRVIDEGSSWNSGLVVVGGDGEAMIEVASGGSVNTSIFALFGRETSGLMTVRDPGSHWSHDGSVRMGFDDSGELFVSAGGKATIGSLEISNSRRRVSQVDVRDSGSVVAVINNLDVGITPSVAGDPFDLIVADSAQVSVGVQLNLRSGNIDTSTGRITVGAGTPAATGTLRVNPEGRFAIAGSVGTLTASEVTVAGGSVIGAGVITAPVVNAGTVAPGSSIGSMTVAQYEQTADGALEFEVAGLSNHDQLVVQGSAQIGGALRVRRLGAFAPIDGQSVVVLSAASTSGAFSDVELIGFSDATGAIVEYSPTSATLVFGPCNERTWFLDADGDSLGGSTTTVQACTQPAGFTRFADDCDDSNGSIWSTPGVTQMLRFDDSQTLAWMEPSDPGATVYQMHVLRSDNPQDFATASCVAAIDASQTHAIDAEVPAPNGLFTYLARAENACAAGLGGLGSGSSGVERQGNTCQ